MPSTALQVEISFRALMWGWETVDCYGIPGVVLMGFHWVERFHYSTHKLPARLRLLFLTGAQFRPDVDPSANLFYLSVYLCFKTYWMTGCRGESLKFQSSRKRVQNTDGKVKRYCTGERIYPLTEVATRVDDPPKIADKTVESGFRLWQQPAWFVLAQPQMGEHTERFQAGLCAIKESVTAWRFMPITATQNAMREKKKLWLNFNGSAFSLSLLFPLWVWNSVKHALVLTWDGYGNMFSYPGLLFSL